jgi:translation initiation factor 1
MADDAKPFHNPFAALEGLRGTMPRTGTPDPKAPHAEEGAPDVRRPGPSGPASQTSTKGPARAVVRLERAGRGGKAVTVVEHLDLRAPDLERWLKALKAQLGCGGVIEGGAIVLQGDHRDRLPTLLADRGVKKITMGS